MSKMTRLQRRVHDLEKVQENLTGAVEHLKKEHANLENTFNEIKMQIVIKETIDTQERLENLTILTDALIHEQNESLLQRKLSDTMTENEDNDTFSKMKESTKKYQKSRKPNKSGKVSDEFGNPVKYFRKEDLKLWDSQAEETDDETRAKTYNRDRPFVATDTSDFVDIKNIDARTPRKSENETNNENNQEETVNNLENKDTTTEKKNPEPKKPKEEPPLTKKKKIEQKMQLYFKDRHIKLHGIVEKRQAKAMMSSKLRMKSEIENGEISPRNLRLKHSTNPYYTKRF